MQLDQTTGKETVLVDLPNETSPIDLMLSPTEDKLFFIDNAPSQKNYIFYTVTLATKEVQKKEVSIDFLPSPEPNGYVSPDGKYIIFTQYACANCKSSVGSASLFNVNTQTFTPIFTPKAHIVTSGEYTISKNEQDITILGWVAGTPL